MIKFKFSLSSIFIFLVIFSGMSFTVIAASAGELQQPFDIVAWGLDNWELILLALSEILALLPGKFSGILKTLIFFLLKMIPPKKIVSKSQLKS